MPSTVISICIPAYKNTLFLKRLLDSIAEQTFQDYEVIITDDSPDDTVENFINNFKDIPSLFYYRNPYSLGTPENWNEAIRRSTGTWIKIMHDDDWFSGPDSLAAFYEAVQPGKDFLFSAYENVYDAGKPGETIRLSKADRLIFENSQMTLVAKNVVGPPSVTFYRRSPLLYDSRMKWLVDIDFYIHYLNDRSFAYIDKPLIKVGISQDQVTQSCFRVPEVEIPEHFLLLEKTGLKHFRNVVVYDAWWRLMRNLKIRSVEQIRQAGFNGKVPLLISAMISDQLSVSARMLQSGISSKIFMFISYLRQKHLINE